MLLALLRRLLRPHWKVIGLIGVFQLVQVVASLVLPGLNAVIIDEGVAQGDTSVIWRSGGIMVAVTAIQVVCNVVAVYLGSRVAMGLGRDLRREVFTAVTQFGSREMATFGPPTLITRTTNDVQQVQLLVFMGLTMLVAAPLTGIGGLILTLRSDIALSALLLIILPVVTVSLALIITRMRPLFRLMQARIDDINGIMREQITGIRVVRAFVTEDHEKARFGEANTLYREAAVSVGKLMSLFFPLIMGVMNLSMIVILWVGAYRIADGTLEIGVLTAVQQYVMQILMAVMMTTFMFMLWPRAEVSAERISEVLGSKVHIRIDQGRTDAEIATGRVELQHASLRYPGAEEDVLQGVSLTIEPGTTTAIVGSTGSGKSTLLRLMIRLLDTTSGTVRFDGYDVKELRPDTVWAESSFVPQSAFLFAGTIRSNLQHGNPEADDDAMWRALEIAQVADVIRRLPQGLEAAVTQGGKNFSGGQRQRLAIARALMRPAKLYAFDDSFSALDLETEARLRAALARHTREAAVVIVAQRITSIRDADQIVVLEAGEVVDVGRHRELLARCEVYREIVYSQLSVQEAV